MNDNNNQNDKSEDELLTKDNKQKKIVIKQKQNEEYVEEALNVSLYYEISSTIYNSLSNLIITKTIINDEYLFKILELQILNLFFLERELKELKTKKYAKEFLQIMSNLMNRSLTIKKSAVKNRIQMLEERNLLIISIINICKNVEKESLEKIRQFDDKSFNLLNDQILALNNFSNDSSKVTLPSDNSGVIIDPIVNKLTSSTPINNLDPNSLANLSKLGILPQHPATNPKFYPYVSKPKYIPLFKKILVSFLLLTAMLILTLSLLAFFVTGKDIDNNSKLSSYNFGWKLPNHFLLTVFIVGLNVSFIYSILKPAKLGRDIYRMSYVLLVAVILWLVFQVHSLWLKVQDEALLETFSSFPLTKFEKEENVRLLKNLSTFKSFEILVYIAIFSTILPFAVILVIAILNPKIDRNKIIKANSEYQNAISSALNGKPYEIDPTLFDDTLDQKGSKGGKNSHKFWNN